jgi:hypothetical protein
MAEQLKDAEVAVDSQTFKIRYLRVHKYNKLNYVSLRRSVFMEWLEHLLTPLEGSSLSFRTKFEMA